MSIKSKIYFSGRKEWCYWLIENHAKEEEVWLVYYKKHTGKPDISKEEFLKNFTMLFKSSKEQCL